LTAKKPTASNAAPAWRSAERFCLSGPSVRLDPRVHAVRPDVADIALADRVFAPHYARATDCHCLAPATPVLGTPRADGQAVSQLLMGEAFAVLDVTGGWAWGYRREDRYVGYVAADAVGPATAPTHLVSAPLALVFAAPDIKSPVAARWPMGARFAGEIADGGFVACAEGFVHQRHVRLIDSVESDPVSVAERLIGQPYLWGGRGGGGIDCSGLVQLALESCGKPCPRDSDQQRDELGQDIPAEASLRRGDLIFLPGHVGMMMDEERLIHANAHWMAVTVEPLAGVLSRLGEGVQVVRKRIEA
jgi:cell wall-associated NlpC family hydrolase